VKSLYFSVDPYLRRSIKDIPVGQPMVSGQVSEVIESKAAGYNVGDKVNFYGQLNN
jgi:NADPH-dependent curcumin reductase CurA